MTCPVRIALVGCGSEKREVPSPARDLYTGPLFKGALREALALAGEERTAILSAEHGLVHLDEVLKPYDLHLASLPRAKREEWGRATAGALVERFGASTAEVHILAGAPYVEALRPHFPASWRVVVPMEGLTQGGRLSWLKRAREARTASAAAVIARADFVAPVSREWLAESRGRQLRYFLPDCDDRVDPDFDFATDTRSAKGAWETEQYAHQLYPSPNFDGLLVSRMEAESPRAKARRLAELGVHRYLRVPPAVPVLGDCGAFGYASEAAPPFSTEDMLAYYTQLGFDMGVSLDHIAAVAASDEDRRARYELTLQNASDFLRGHRAAGHAWQPWGAVQGWSPATYAEAARQVVAMGYHHIALGGLVMAPTEAVLAILQEVHQVVPASVGIHLFGLARAEAARAFVALGVRSVDSSSPLRRAWLHARENYITLDGDAYAAVRVPYANGRAAKSLAGETLAKAQRLEKSCLEGLAACERGPVPAGLLDALEEYEALTLPGRKSMRAENQRTLEAQPWRTCPCALCQRHGIQVLVFRGNDRNRRRGFHNVWAWYRLLGKALRREAAPVVALVGGSQLDLFNLGSVTRAPAYAATTGGVA
ncbi:hypothetical protein D7X74_37820 [Corallococcus sp. CA047B]|uniref:tRNA-guanine transglycosylase DpdA n=1 Tax=Corallococcus sp. CA047B TaxID=2316729 RepID=UPI000EA29971|nr:tRNA-guanine transglycosylase DpdA [Corallococcus sp. CA047B]RKH01481.1 hypothetical protein D7X74_37820 [Corallococcus sp. CA047B]